MWANVAVIGLALVSGWIALAPIIVVIGLNLLFSKFIIPS